jgi:hypothetical protein
MPEEFYCVQASVMCCASLTVVFYLLICEHGNPSHFVDMLVPVCETHYDAFKIAFV